MRRIKSIKTRFLALFVVFLPFLLTSNTYSKNEIIQISCAFRSAVKKINPAVVYIRVERQNYVGAFGRYVLSSGSGVIVDAKEGYILTANHVVEGADKVKVHLMDGRVFTATDVRSDPQTDVAVVKISPDNLPVAKLGDSGQLEVGDWVLAFGSPFGESFQNSVSAGIVSAKGRKTRMLGSLGIEDYIQTDAAINRGNSGGPLANIRGEIVGINSSIISTTGMYAGLGFAIPSNLIRPVVDDLIKQGEVVRGWLGITVNSLKAIKETMHGSLSDEVLERGGVYVLSTVQGGPSEGSGLAEGDVIYSIDGKAVGDPSELVRIISVRKPGEVVDCSVWRDGKELSIKVVLGRRPEKLEAELFTAAKKGIEKSQSYQKLGLVVSDYEVSIIEKKKIYRREAVIVSFVLPGSLADKFGVRSGDVIITVDGRKVEETGQFERLIKKANLKRGVNLAIIDAFGERKVVIKNTDG